MSTLAQIRVCKNPDCGLRYPISEDHPFGERCPSCLGSTSLVLSHNLQAAQIGPGHLATIKLEALLDNVRSAWNVGSIFRTADGFGVERLYLCGITPTPEEPALTKTSLGAELTLAWEYVPNALKIAARLKADGHKLVALEQDQRAQLLTEFQFTTNDNQTPILILGNEVTGVDPDLLDLCDHILHIPMAGTKRSLNVEVAFAIAAFSIARLYNP